MRLIMGVALASAAGFYLFVRYQKMNAYVPQPPAPPAISAQPAPDSFLQVSEIKRVRKSVDDFDAGVRWAAIEFLFNVRDPEAIVYLSKAASEDPDTDIRLKAIALLKTAQDIPIVKLQGLIKALSDYDTGVRIAALRAIGDLGDANAAPWVADVLRDAEPEVRKEALHTLSKFQDRRKEEFAALAQKLKEQYEIAVLQAKKQQEE
jgi:HEAT repeat protein